MQPLVTNPYCAGQEAGSSEMTRGPHILFSALNSISGRNEAKSNLMDI